MHAGGREGREEGNMKTGRMGRREKIGMEMEEGGSEGGKKGGRREEGKTE